MKKPFVTLDQLQAITEQYPTPFHLYDEAGIRANARRLKSAFSWNPGFREYFAVRGYPHPRHPQAAQGGGLRCGLLLSHRADDGRALRLPGQ